MKQSTGWVGAGVLTAGVSAALLTGAGAADADADGPSDPGPAKTVSSGGEKPGKDTTEPRRGTPRLKRADRPSGTVTARLRRTAETRAAQASTLPSPDPRPARTATKPVHRLTSLRTEIRDELRERLAPRTVAVPDTRVPAVGRRVPPTSQAKPTVSAAEPRDDVTAPAPSVPLLGLGQPDFQPVIDAVGSAIFDAIGTLIRTADGPPLVPRELRDSVEVSSSTLVVAPGNEVPADWYFPTQGEPERLIYLQHGFLATGPMYSYTASYLAERTNSVVVVTTVTSNPFTEGGMWLGGDNMHRAVAQLFLDPDRKALNTSMSTAMLKAGQESSAVPQQFVLVGHSLGGGFAPGVAGYYAEGLVARRADGQDAPNNLAGVVLLDGVPPEGSLPNAMDRLAQLEASNGNDPADYIPVYEIGAPSNLFNSVSTVNGDLSAARPGKFNGLVVDGGVHMDGMLGGNPLIQGVAYLVAGIPQPQNPPAVQWLMAGWVNDMFEGNIDPATGRCLTDCHGIYGAPGDPIDIDGDQGGATGVVIDSGSSPDELGWYDARFVPIAASFIPRSVLSLWA
ncbi:alpha/beta hydrolase [Mycolicibacterium sp. HK-90]|uniref:alpha/beta hydrolase n=1 Tax=Mycolicibacterium sp. HK-90 TaxID=3056937 RepID=UPI00265A0A9F|nr:alpha/beta hydrolase [Mycolicibacterium sp. HK-90]WKG04102.1 alpha/beta hydrolase [Mycolicibacterium sp. HK-90]